MVNANKLAKGDIVLGIKSSTNEYTKGEIRQYIFLELQPTSVKLRDREKGWIISQSLGYFERSFTKEYEWSEWRPDKKLLSCVYRTNRKDIEFKGKGVKVKVSCHDSDIFELGKGLDLARRRWLEKKQKADEIKKVNSTDITGRVYGDFKARKLHGFDSAGNPLWQLDSLNNEEKIYATVWDLENNKVDTESTYSKNVSKYKDMVTLYMKNKESEDYVEFGKGYVDSFDNKETKEDNHSSYLSVVQHQEVKGDLLSAPSYYFIAHCIPADLTFWGETAKRINSFKHMRTRIEKEDLWYEANVGDCIVIDNFFNLIATPQKYCRPSLEDLRICVNIMSEYCIENNIQYLAMPHIGCGHNKLNWDEVKDMIIETFDQLWESMESDYKKMYGNQLYHINILFYDYK